MATADVYGTVRAPEFPADAEWINTPRPLSLAALRGRLVLLDFWTYGCINCIHVIPDLRRLEEEFAEGFAVIGVHSAKFANERRTENLKRIVERYGIEHPVVNDADFSIWQAYAVRAWPTTVLIDPRGRIIGTHSGEGVYRVFRDLIAEGLARYEEDGVLERTPLAEAPPARETREAGLLRFPGKVLADETSGRLFVADTGHHRIVVATLDGEAVDVIGSGQPGFLDGPFDEARLNAPQGMAIEGATLYIADTENHAIRAADLVERTLRTVAGVGDLGYAAGPTTLSEAILNSPWDLEIVDGRLYIAMAGLHQIWVMDREADRIEPYAGTRAEALLDGPRARAAFAQPSGLSTDGQVLYLADAESSAVRSLETGPYARVQTIIGEGLFEFGDVDGGRPTARLQHPLAVEWHRGTLYVADTYNHKIKVVDPDAGTVRTFLGTGRPGDADGAEPEFYEPGGLSAAEGRLYVADTNNHSIRVAGLDTSEVRTLALRDPRGVAISARGEADLRPTLLAGEERVAPGSGRVVAAVRLPEGYKVNAEAPSALVWERVEGEAVSLGGSEGAVHAAGEPLAYPAEFRPGRAVLHGELTLYYCREMDSGVCLLEHRYLLVPVWVAEEAEGHDVVVEIAVHPEA